MQWALALFVLRRARLVLGGGSSEGLTGGVHKRFVGARRKQCEGRGLPQGDDVVLLADRVAHEDLRTLEVRYCCKAKVTFVVLINDVDGTPSACTMTKDSSVRSTWPKWEMRTAREALAGNFAGTPRRPVWLARMHTRSRPMGLPARGLEKEEQEMEGVLGGLQ